MTGIVQVEKKYFRIALIWSFLLVIGIPMIVFGAVNFKHGIAWILMMVAGIVFTASGVVAVPIMWVEYAEKKRLARMAVIISGSESMTIDVLGDTMGRSQESTRKDLRKLLSCGWIQGYAFVDQEDRVKRTGLLDRHQAVCDFCGATFEYQGSDAKCPYCGRIFTGTPKN